MAGLPHPHVAEPISASSRSAAPEPVAVVVGQKGDASTHELTGLDGGTQDARPGHTPGDTGQPASSRRARVGHAESMNPPLTRSVKVVGLEGDDGAIDRPRIQWFSAQTQLKAVQVRIGQGPPMEGRARSPTTSRSRQRPALAGGDLGPGHRGHWSPPREVADPASKDRPVLIKTG